MKRTAHINAPFVLDVTSLFVASFLYYFVLKLKVFCNVSKDCNSLRVYNSLCGLKTMTAGYYDPVALFKLWCCLIVYRI